MDDYAKQPKHLLPDVFDVLNCQEGCNIGTACVHDSNLFEMNKKMRNEKTKITKERSKYIKELYELFDKKLKVNDFIRRYDSMALPLKNVSENELEKAFIALSKNDNVSRAYDCGACGSKTCYDMAVKIAKGINTPENCIEKMHRELKEEHDVLASFELLVKDIVPGLKNITASFNTYEKMVTDINSIVMQINIIAINASIEAAHAGIHGKSFAVVAEEIRRLADASKKILIAAEQSSAMASESIITINGTVKEISEKTNIS